MAEKNIVVIMGGRSSEHEVSLVSAQTVVKNINTDIYNVIMIGITKEGEWKLIESVGRLKDGSWVKSKTRAFISPDTHKNELILIRDGKADYVHVDVVFPVLHGLNGEDGTIQGLFELAKIPYVGCGIIPSACGMDKFYTKTLVESIGIRQAKFVGVRSYELKDMDAVIKRVEEGVPYPIFVKPSKAGSSCGVSKAENREELVAALRLAAENDDKILCEETIVGREIECGVLGGMDAQASGVGEILAADTFYSYDAKYNNADSRTIVGPELPEGVEDEIRRDALEIFKVLDGYGLARVDFFLTKDTNEVVFNEINTLPGFTAISMYPMLWAAKGHDIKTLIQELIDLAVNRYQYAVGNNR
ncbi:MAG: D-alanine--D-alanine ligase family protein [Lachnospiraceae bacterium]|nr:D-alanine--D-alanine ligase family protein [Lachnospiraceae bacterium]